MLRQGELIDLASLSVGSMATKLAFDVDISDYEIWRSLKNIDNDIFQIERKRLPVPLHLVRWRGALAKAYSKREALRVLAIRARLPASATFHDPTDGCGG